MLTLGLNFLLQAKIKAGGHNKSLLADSGVEVSPLVIDETADEKQKTADPRRKKMLRNLNSALTRPQDVSTDNDMDSDESPAKKTKLTEATADNRHGP